MMHMQQGVENPLTDLSFNGIALLFAFACGLVAGHTGEEEQFASFGQSTRQIA